MGGVVVEPLEPRVRIPKTAEVVAGTIRRQIVRGELAEGDALPSEAELTARFGISRPTLREALRILESEGLIDISRGARTGAKVRRPRREIVSHHTGLLMQAEGVTLADVYEARVEIFAPAVARLATRRTKADVRRLRRAAEELRALADDPPALLAAAAHFNLTVLELAGNRTLLILAGMLNDIVEFHLRAVARDWVSHPSHAREARRVIAAVEQVIDLVEARQGQEAQAFWRQQMEQSARYSLERYGPKTVVELLG